jgi:hypothetical protein
MDRVVLGRAGKAGSGRGERKDKVDVL